MLTQSFSTASRTPFVGDAGRAVRRPVRLQRVSRDDLYLHAGKSRLRGLTVSAGYVLDCYEMCTIPFRECAGQPVGRRLSLIQESRSGRQRGEKPSPTAGWGQGGPGRRPLLWRAPGSPHTENSPIPTVAVQWRSERRAERVGGTVLEEGLAARLRTGVSAPSTFVGRTSGTVVSAPGQED